MTNQLSAVMFLEMGVKLVKQGDLGKAVLAFGQSIQLNPQYTKAYNNLGLVLRKRKQFSEAEACFRKAISLNPHDALLFNNLGLVLSNMDLGSEAVACLEQAIRLNPHIAAIHNNLGIVFEEQNCPEQAEASFRRAIALKGDYAEAFYNLGTLLRNTQIELAEKYICQALRLRPNYLDAELSLALLYLLSGNLEKGWIPYEKARRKKYKVTKLPIPYWRGEELAGHRILMFWEYGFGDTIQFVRYVDEVLSLTSKVVLWVQKPLARLFQFTYPEIRIYSGLEFPEGNYEFVCSLLSLPLLFHTTNRTVPPPRPYRLTQRDVSEKWRLALALIDQEKKYRVGLVWACHPKHENYIRRSIPFAELKVLFENMPITWVSLQVGERAQECLQAARQIVDFSGELTDYLETAALAEQLDLVITVDTSVAHLAGTLGKPTWLLLPFAPDWRWQLQRRDTPWYKSVCLFRQQSMGDWATVIQQVKAALWEKVGKGS